MVINPIPLGFIYTLEGLYTYWFGGISQLKVGRLWSPIVLHLPRTQRWRTSNAWCFTRWTNQRKCHVCSCPSSMFTGFLWVVSKICFQDIRSITLIAIIHVAQAWNISWIGEMMSIRKCWLTLKEEATLFPFFLISKRFTNMKGFFFLSVYFIAKNILTSDSNILNTTKSKQFIKINFQAFSSGKWLWSGKWMKMVGGYWPIFQVQVLATLKTTVWWFESTWRTKTERKTTGKRNGKAVKMHWETAK